MDKNLVYQFDTKTNTLNTPVIQGKVPNRGFTNSVSHKGKIYIFGGQLNSIFFGNLDILDTINLNWEVGSILYGPLPRSKYTATLVHGVIYYIGGIQQDEFGQNYSPMTDIYQYDIVENTWSLKTATVAIGDVPDPRAGHSAVLFEDKIYIYGGMFITNIKETIAMLDITNLVWSIPPLDNPSVPNLVYHTATLVDKFMFIAFGNTTDVTALNYNFYIFDLGDPKLQWVNLTAEETTNLKDFKIPTPESNTPKSSNESPSTPKSSTSSTPAFVPPVEQQNSISSKEVIGLSVGLAAIGLAAAIVLTLFYRRKKKGSSNPSVVYELRQNYFPGQELPRERNYFPGSESPPPPPPPPKPDSIKYNNVTFGPNKYTYY